MLLKRRQDTDINSKCIAKW